MCQIKLIKVTCSRVAAPLHCQSAQSGSWPEFEKECEPHSYEHVSKHVCVHELLTYTCIYVYRVEIYELTKYMWADKLHTCFTSASDEVTRGEIHRFDHWNNHRPPDRRMYCVYCQTQDVAKSAARTLSTNTRWIMSAVLGWRGLSVIIGI